MTRYEAIEALVQKWRDSADKEWNPFSHAACEVANSLNKCSDELERALALPEDSIPPIERDEGYDRTYIPLPGGWEVQTKGKGSTFRICDTKSGDRLAIPPSPYLHETLERMAREIHAASASPKQTEDSKVVNAELYGLAIPLADNRAAKVLFEMCPTVYENGKWWYMIDRLSKDSLIRLNLMPALRYLELREQSGEPMPYKVVRDGDKVRFL